MKLFDEHKILRFALLFACFMFAAFVPDILHFSGHVMAFVPYFVAIIFIAYLALFYTFPCMDQMMIDVSHEGFWTFNVSTGKVYWSNRVAELIGAKELLEDSFSALESYVMESDWVAFREKFMKALETGEDFSEVLRLSSPMKGKPEEIMIAGRLQMDSENRPIRVIGSITASDTSAIAREKYYYAYQDALTGVYNRKFFLEKLKVDVDMAAQKPGYTFGVALLDIDSFGAINACTLSTRPACKKEKFTAAPPSTKSEHISIFPS